MGASGWDYIVPFRTDLATTLADLHQQEFERQFGNGSEYGSLAELWADEEFMGEEGTHSILDVIRVDTAVLPEDECQDDYSLRPLPADRLRHHFGTERPTRARFEEVWRRQADALRGHRGWYGAGETLVDEVEMRWTGLYALLHRDGEVAEVAIWGRSGD